MPNNQNYINSVKPPEPAQGTPEATANLDDLLALMARLRAECPWDIKQTNHSLIPYAIEESYELAEALQEGDVEDIKSELGDVLLQVIFHCQLYAEQGQFNLADVIQTLQAKLIRRHPHVFEADKLKDEKAVKQRWNEIKAEEAAEREARGKRKSSLDNVKSGSALMQAQNLQTVASKLGFDWQGVDGALDKFEEELEELKEAISNQQNAVLEKQKAEFSIELEKEMGDCLFGLVNVARKLDLDAETAALTCVHKFKSRFKYIEEQLAKQGLTADNSSLELMDRLWEEAKLTEKESVKD